MKILKIHYGQNGIRLEKMRTMKKVEGDEEKNDGEERVKGVIMKKKIQMIKWIRICS